MVLQFSMLVFLASQVSLVHLEVLPSTPDDYGVDVYSPDFQPPNPYIEIPTLPKVIHVDRYYDSTGLDTLLKQLSDRYSNIMRVSSLGYDSRGEAIWAVEISHDVNYKRRQLKPMFKFVANIQGDDAVSYAMMVSLIQYLVYNDDVNTRVYNMLEDIDIWIVPNVNTHGFMESTEGRCEFGHTTNMDGIYLDGDFPDQFLDDVVWPKTVKHAAAVETRHMMRFIKENPFVLSGNLQGGAIVASYPFDSLPAEEGVPIITPDIEIFHRMAKKYAKSNTMMAPGTACKKYFPDGITNGHLWRRKTGGMQDYNYIHSNCFELTFYLSCCKYPEAALLPFYWDANLDPMLAFIESTRQGVYGLVETGEGHPVKDAVIRVEGFTKEIKATEDGEYWRLLSPGVYNVTVKAPGCVKTQEVEVKPHVQVNFVLNQKGVYGEVRDEQGNFVPKAVLKVNGFPDVEETERGEYWIPLELGTYTIVAKAPTYKSTPNRVYLTKKKRYDKLNFVLTPHQGVSGQVLDEKNYPIKGAVIEVFYQKSVKKVRTDEAGMYWEKLDPRQPVTLTATAPGYTNDTAAIQVVDTAVEHNFRLTFQRHEGVHGVVKDDTGKPVAEAVVRVVGEGEDKSVKVDANGEYAMKLFLGKYTVTVNALNYRTEKFKAHLTNHHPYALKDFALKPYRSRSKNPLALFCSRSEGE